MNQPLADLLKEARKEKGLTLRTVEEKTGISNAYLCQLENKKISSPSPNILRKLADLYEVSYSRLLQSAGYPVEIDDQSKPFFRSLSKLGNISADEERELVTYLRFLRMKKKGEL